MIFLIVEDDPMVRNINKEFLNRIDSSAKVIEVATVGQAKKILTEQAIDVVLLDVYLGTESGPELLAWIRMQAIESDVILITADASSETVETSLRLGAIDYLIKPFTFERLNEAIQTVKARRRTLSKECQVSQEAIDTLLAQRKDRENGPQLNEKGINTRTYQLILETVKSTQRAMTAQEIADITALARVTVRRYLAAMVESCILEEYLQYGKIGRPQKYYAIKK